MLKSVNFDSNVPVYDQIENHVQYGIASGELKEGDKLPTVRELADRLGVNPNTVAKSYRDLEVMKLITGRRGEGYFINKGVKAKVRQKCLTQVTERLYEVVSEAKAAGMTKKQIESIIGKSLDAEADLYGATPKALLSLVK